MSCFVMYSLAQGLKKITSYVTKAKESRKRKFFLFSSLKAWDLFHLLGDPRLFMNLPKNYFSQSNFEDKQDLIRGLGETEIPLLEDTNKILHASGPRGKEKWPQRILDKTYLLVKQGRLASTVMGSLLQEEVWCSETKLNYKQTSAPNRRKQTVLKKCS